jgi:hypothetical protein
VLFSPLRAPRPRATRRYPAASPKRRSSWRPVVIVGHRPTEIATVRIKDVARVVDADLAEPLVVLSLALVHCSRPFVLPFRN